MSSATWDSHSMMQRVTNLAYGMEIMYLKWTIFAGWPNKTVSYSICCVDNVQQVFQLSQRITLGLRVAVFTLLCWSMHKDPQSSTVNLKESPFFALHGVGC